jgi:hypothetical protein
VWVWARLFVEVNGKKARKKTSFRGKIFVVTSTPLHNT